MGVERAVTRWYTQRQLLLDEIASLEAKLAPSLTDEGAAPKQENTNLKEQKERLAKTRERLRLLGPCPKPMMG